MLFLKTLPRYCGSTDAFLCPAKDSLLLRAVSTPVAPFPASLLRAHSWRTQPSKFEARNGGTQSNQDLSTESPNNRLAMTLCNSGPCRAAAAEGWVTGSTQVALLSKISLEHFTAPVKYLFPKHKFNFIFNDYLTVASIYQCFLSLHNFHLLRKRHNEITNTTHILP